MIVNLIFALVHQIFSILNSLPTVSVLPFGIDEVLVQAMGSIRALFDELPILLPLFNIGIYYLLFEVSLMVLKMIFGHRAPHA